LWTGQLARTEPQARVLAPEQLPDPNDSGGDVRRRPLEIGEQVVREIGERNGVKMLRLVRVFASVRPRPVEGGLKLTDSALGICFLALLPLLGGFQTRSQLTDDLASRFRECERLLASGDQV
jgi:hypothetical protein